MNKKIFIRIILIVLILLWMWMVFGFSSHDAGTSSRLSLTIARFLVKDEAKALEIQPIIRKLAHLSEYMARWIFVLWIIFNV